jgi:transcriptional antiterminator NusG
MEAAETSPKRWYVVRVYSGHEYKVKTYMEREIPLSKLSDRISSVMVPSEKIVEVKDKKKKSRVRTFFPGYILIEAVLDKESKHFILETPSVLGFIGNRGEGTRSEPQPLQYEEVKRLIGKIEERKDVEVLSTPFMLGDPVKVIDGPFNNFSGVVQEVHEDKMKLKVMVSIFGRKTPIELDFSQVEAEK